MTHEEYWLADLGLKVVGAVTTLAAILVALFGETWRRRIYPPQLEVSLERPKGVLAAVELMDSQSMTTRTAQARWYHLVVKNRRRWSPATKVQVVVERLEALSADGTFRPRWTGELPLQWAYLGQTSADRTIGPEARCDFCNVVEGKWLSITTVAEPTPNDPVMLTRIPAPQANIRLRVTVRARAVEADSAPATFEVAWNGQWHDGNDEMQQHFSVRQK